MEKPTLTKKAVRKLESLAKYLEKLPEGLFYLGTWSSMGRSKGRYLEKICNNSIPGLAEDHKTSFEVNGFDSCGTTCCVAGWQVVKEGFCIGNDGEVFKSRRSKKVLGKAEDIARETLGIDTKSAAKLFVNWPAQFRNKRSGKTAAQRIRHFIKTGK